MVKVQSRKIGDKYEQFWIPLPKALVKSLKWKKKDELDIFVERGDLVLRKV